MVKGNHILLIGPYMANIGGISMHIRRLVSMLQDVFLFSFVDEGHVRFDNIFNIRSLNIISYFRLLRDADLVHIHSGHYLLRAFHIIFCKLILRKPTVVTVHRNPAIEPLQRMTRWLLRKCDHVIMVNREGFDLMDGENSNGKFILLPAFLPPVMDQEPQLPDSVLNWVAAARENRSSTILVSNAWNLVLNNGEDLYGLDLCIDAADRLKHDGHDNFYFLFVVASNTGQQELMSSYEKLIVDRQLGKHFLIWQEPLSFVRLLELADIMLRTTNTDGDAISVREALYLHKTVIASDVAMRPDGVLIFRNRSVDSLVETILASQSHTSAELLSDVDYRLIYTQLYSI